MLLPTRILLVDDEEAIRNSLAQFLEDYDFDVSTAGSGEEALEFLLKRPYDLGIIDLRLPGMNGEALILRAHEMQPAMVFLVHTGSACYMPSEQLRQIGIDSEHVIPKPVADMGLFVKEIEKLVGGGQEG